MPRFKPYVENPDDAYISYENTAVFYASAYQYIILAIVFAKGPPYRKYIFTNRKYPQLYNDISESVKWSGGLGAARICCVHVNIDPKQILSFRSVNHVIDPQIHDMFSVWLI